MRRQPRYGGRSVQQDQGQKMVRVLGWVGLRLIGLVILIAVQSNSPEGKRMRAYQDCLDTVKVGGVSVPTKSASEREACVQRVIHMND